MSLFYVPRSATYTDAAPTISTPWGPLRLSAQVGDLKLPIADRAVMAGNDDRYLSWEGDFGEIALKFLAPHPRIDPNFVLTALRVAVWRFELREALPLALEARFSNLPLTAEGEGTWTNEEQVLCLGASHGGTFLADGLHIEVVGAKEVHLALAWAPNDEGVREGRPVNPAARAALDVNPKDFDF